MYKVGIITLSDKGFKGARQDESGMLIKEELEKEFQVIKQVILPDEKEELVEVLKEWCNFCDLILTTGGTGLSIRDITPEATLSVADKVVPGISEGMRMMSLKQTPFAMLSRGVSVQRQQTLIINLPGNPKGVKEHLVYLYPILLHALDIITDKKTEH